MKQSAARQGERKPVRSYEAFVDGQRVTVQVFEPRLPAERDAEPMSCRDDSDTPVQRQMRRERERERGEW